MPLDKTIFIYIIVSSLLSDLTNNRISSVYFILFIYFSGRGGGGGGGGSPQNFQRIPKFLRDTERSLDEIYDLIL